MAVSDGSLSSVGWQFCGALGAWSLEFEMMKGCRHLVGHEEPVALDDCTHRVLEELEENVVEVLRDVGQLHLLGSLHLHDTHVTCPGEHARARECSVALEPKVVSK